MGFLSKIFGKGSATVLPPASGDAGLEAEHLQFRRAVERCDMLRHAREAGQMDLPELVATLQRNGFSAEIIRKAVAESWGEEVPDRLLT